MESKRPICFSHLYYRSKNSIAQGALTNSKRPESLVLGAYPTHAKSGQAGMINSDTGITYADYICGLGTNLLGYGHYKIATEIQKEYVKGSLFSIGSETEVVAAEKLKELFPFCERVKFLKTGTEACMAAVKIARAHTGKDKILVEGYHGWADMFVDQAPGYGVDKNAIKNTDRGLEKNWEKLEKGEYGAVIIEPVDLDDSTERKMFLNKLREVCTKTKTVLIFDEIITGFRFPKYSVANYFGVIPDLICLGKAMGGGLPLSCVGGKRDIMEGKEYFVSSTFAGDTLALRAFITLKELLNSHKYDLEDLWGSGGQFIKEFNSIAPDKIQIKGYATRGRFTGDKDFINVFFQETALALTLFGPSFFYCFGHIGENEYTLNLCKDIIRNIKSGKAVLKYEPPRSPFATEQRNSDAKLTKHT